jgi:hypothetical protein
MHNSQASDKFLEEPRTQVSSLAPSRSSISPLAVDGDFVKAAKKRAEARHFPVEYRSGKELIDIEPGVESGTELMLGQRLAEVYLSRELSETARRASAATCQTRDFKISTPMWRSKLV